jgi:hypothetical protein
MSHLPPLEYCRFHYLHPSQARLHSAFPLRIFFKEFNSVDFEQILSALRLLSADSIDQIVDCQSVYGLKSPSRHCLIFSGDCFTFDKSEKELNNTLLSEYYCKCDSMGKISSALLFFAMLFILS